jgi:hypothetical protein
LVADLLGSWRVRAVTDLQRGVVDLALIFLRVQDSIAMLRRDLARHIGVIYRFVVDRSAAFGGTNEVQ